MRGDWLRFVAVIFTMMALLVAVLWLIHTEERIRQRTGAHVCTAAIRGTHCACVQYGPHDIFVPRGEEPTKRCHGK